MRLPDPPILLISDRRRAKRPLPEELAAAAAGGCRWMMLREKDLPEQDLAALLSEVQAALAGYEVCLTVNSALGLVSRRGLSGLHLPATGAVREARRLLGSASLIGQSCHSLEAVLRAAEEGANYATISPVFPSISKDDSRQSLGVEILRKATIASPIPLLALGGVSQENIGVCRRSGVAGAVVLGAVLGQANPEGAMAEVIAAWENAGLP